MHSKRDPSPQDPPLLSQIRALHQHLSAQARSQWARDVPFGELVSDRWERAQTLGFGEETSIYQNSYIFGNVKVGSHTWIGPFTLLDGSGELEIGHHCSISAGVHIYSHNTVKWAISGGKAPYEHAPVHIGNCCFIGPHSIISDGVTIEDHVVVGAHSFVNRNVPAFSIVAGTPARVIGNVVLGEGDRVEFEYFG